MNRSVSRPIATGGAIVLLLAVAACASEQKAPRPAGGGATSSPSPAGGLASTAAKTPSSTVPQVVPTTSQPTLTLRIGEKIVAQLPVNPLGKWNAPIIEPTGVLAVTADFAPSGTSMAITAVGVGTATVTSYTTPNGDPRPPGTIPTPTWRQQITVTS